MKFLNSLNGYKTDLAVVGLVGLSVDQGSTGQFDQASPTFLSALAAAGLRHAVEKATP